MSIKDNFPTVLPQLLIDIANSEILDPRVVSSRASVATYYDKFGVLQTAGANVPRVGYNPATGAVEGLIREAQGTNIRTYSTAPNAANSYRIYGTYEANATTAPDGTLTACKITGTGAVAGFDNYSNDYGGVSGVPQTYSVYINPIDAVSVRMFLTDNYSFTLFTFATESWTNNSPQQFGSGAEKLANGFWRLSVTVPNKSNAFWYWQVYLDNAANTTASAYFWGVQLENNLYPTSYIKTEASQVTRAADSFLLTNTADYDTDAFTAISQPFGVTSVSSGTVTLNGDVPIERLYVYPNNIAQDEINAVVENDGWWSWRIVGATFALPQFSTDGSIQVDWGDGTVETLTTAVHTFTNASPHTVKFRQMTGTYFRPIINNNATYKNMVVAVGSAPSNMIVDCYYVFYGCNNLKSFDATLAGRTDFTLGWLLCTSLTSFPLIDTSSGTNFNSTWYNCNSLTSFPLINTSSGTNFESTWRNCSSLISFPLINTSAGTNFVLAWFGCSSLTSFPLLNVNSGAYFYQAWYGCSSLTSFPANMFDSWTGLPVANCFLNTWATCTALTTTSVENILVSIDTSGQSAPATGTEITISYNVATGALTSPTTSAITSLKGKNWTIKINGVLQ
jgi:hypothetical protein